MKSNTSQPRILLLVICLFFLAYPTRLTSFGFHAHRVINRMAVFSLPPEMIGFYKQHIEFLAERSVDPDRRAHAVPGEAPRHYIDIDHFGEDPFSLMPRQWEEALALYGEDTLMEYGVLPWHIEVVFRRLRHAFAGKDFDRVLMLSAHLGHYVADACTPLHTTKDYNGRTPSQRGIHAFWESRLPELFTGDYDYLCGRASYVDDPLAKAWELVESSHMKVDSIYLVFDSLMKHFPRDQVHAHEMRGQSMQRVYSVSFSEAFHQSLHGMVERQMRKAVKATSDLWFTAWVDAGQPRLPEPGQHRITDRFLRHLGKDRKKWDKITEPAGREMPQ